LNNSKRIFSYINHLLQELKAKVSLSLDAWTSSNQFAFLAIIMHYVTNDWQLSMSLPPFLCPTFNFASTEELLIDFREIIGKHSGANLAEAVWNTLELYRLKNRV
jgi:hypothetical protein